MPERLSTARTLEERDRARRELARRLHSQAAQQITALQFNLEVVVRSAGKLSPEAAAALADCVAIASECAHEIRRVSSELHPPLLDELGLAAALSGLPEMKRVALKVPDPLPALGPDTAIALYRIVEEALPGISTLRIEPMPKSILLEADLRSVSPVIRERVRGLGGKISRGARRVRITVPLKAKAARSGSSR
jgi:signal transduction histidine kinase